MKGITILFMLFLFVRLFASINQAGMSHVADANILSTSFEASEGYNLGTLDGQNGWEHGQLPGSWQVQDGVSHSGSRAIKSPSGFDDTEARATTKSFTAKAIGDMALYLRRDDSNLVRNNFYVGFNTDQGENPEVTQICIVGMGQEGIILQNNNELKVLSASFASGQWYKIHFKWDADTCQASVNDDDFISISNLSHTSFARIYVLARGQATAYLDDIRDLSPSGQILNLINSVNGFNLKQGIENSLDAKLYDAQRALNASNAGDLLTACNLLTAFLNEASAQSGHALTIEQGNQLISQAQQIRAFLGCQ